MAGVLKAFGGNTSGIQISILAFFSKCNFIRACSLVVERPAHNRVDVGSNPTRPILFLCVIFLCI